MARNRTLWGSTYCTYLAYIGEGELRERGLSVLWTEKEESGGLMGDLQ